MVEHISNKISGFQERGRAFAMKHKDTLLPTKVTHVGNGMERIVKLHSDGYSVIVMTTHPTKMDELHEYPILWEEEAFEHTTILVPTAYDQCTPIVRTAAQATGVKLKPVVTEEVKRRKGDKGLPRGYGNMGYFREAIQRTNDETDPGVIFLAPDAGRKPSLNAPNTRAAEFLLTATKDAKIAVLFMGVEVNGVKDYKEADGFNLGKLYTVNVGNAYTTDEILRIMPYFRREFDIAPIRPGRRPFYGVERWIYQSQFPSLTSESYRNPPQQQIFFGKQDGEILKGT